MLAGTAASTGAKGGVVNEPGPWTNGLPVAGTCDYLSLIVTEAGGGQLSIEVRGELDLCSAPLLNTALERCLASGARRVTLELVRLSFIDAAGIGTLVQARQRVHAVGGTLLLVHPPALLVRLLTLVRLDGVLLAPAAGDARDASRA